MIAVAFNNLDLQKSFDSYFDAEIELIKYNRPTDS